MSSKEEINMSNKINFKELKSNKKQVSVIVKIGDKEIKVLQYLPVNEKLNLITRILQVTSNNDYNFVNPVQLDVYTNIEIVKAYSNIEFDAEDEASPADLYDELEKADIIDAIVGAIPKSEYQFITEGVEETINAYYQYQNSALGILENISKDYSGLNLDAKNIQEKLGDPNNLSLLKNIMEKLG
jgi:hypothetical protein